VLGTSRLVGALSFAAEQKQSSVVVGEGREVGSLGSFVVWGSGMPMCLLYACAWPLLLWHCVVRKLAKRVAVAISHLSDIPRFA
jgi:hypothetical protein